MDLYLRPMREQDAREVFGWRYEGEYAVYNLADWDDAVQKGFDITSEEVRRAQWICVFAGGVLVGFGRLTPVGSRMLIGIGLRPDLCGRGLGKSVMRLLLQEASRRMPDAPAVLTVRTFNVRARKCYEALGFSVLTSYTSDTQGENVEYFYMERPLQKEEGR